MIRPTMRDRGVKLCAEVVGARVFAVAAMGSGWSHEDGLLPERSRGSEASRAMLRVW